MNKNKARWKLYRLLKKHGIITSKHGFDYKVVAIQAKRGGYSYAYLENWINEHWNTELAVFSDPVRFVKELLEAY